MPRSGTSPAALILLLLFNLAGYSQQHLDDLALLRERSPQPEPHRHAPSFMWVPGSSVLLKYNPVSLGFGGLMFVYQYGISRHFSATCLYSPSCSDYGRLLVRDYGLVKGVFLTADRVMRCNRLAAVDILPSSFHVDDHKVHEGTDIYR